MLETTLRLDCKKLAKNDPFNIGTDEDIYTSLVEEYIINFIDEFCPVREILADIKESSTTIQTIQYDRNNMALIDRLNVLFTVLNKLHSPSLYEDASLSNIDKKPLSFESEHSFLSIYEQADKYLIFFVDKEKTICYEISNKD